jgi:hypothetical protein
MFDIKKIPFAGAAAIGLSIRFLGKGKQDE